MFVKKIQSHCYYLPVFLQLLSPLSSVEGAEPASPILESSHGEQAPGSLSIDQGFEPIPSVDLEALLSSEAGESTQAYWNVSVPDGAKPLPLSEAVSQAVVHNLGIRISTLAPERAQLRLDWLNGRYDPSLSLQARPYQTVEVCTSTVACADPSGILVSNNLQMGLGLGWLLSTGGRLSLGGTVARQFSNRDDFVGEDPINSLVASVSLSQPLLRGAGYSINQLDFQQAAADLSVAQESLLQSLQALVQEVHIVYWDLMVQRTVLKLRQQSLSFARQQAEMTEERIRLGFVAPVEVFAAQQTVAGREVEVAVAENEVLNAEVSLRQLLNLPLVGDTALCPVDPPSVEVGSLTAASVLERALEQDRELKGLKLQVKQQEMGERQALNNLLPDLAVSASAGLIRTGSEGGGMAPSWDAALTLSTDLGLRAARAELRQSELEREGALFQVEQREQTLEVEVLAAVRAYETAQSRVELNRQARRLAELKLEAEKERLERGESTLKNLLDYLEDRDGARLAELRAHRDLAAAQLQIKGLSGELLPDFQLDIESVQY